MSIVCCGWLKKTGEREKKEGERKSTVSVVVFSLKRKQTLRSHSNNLKQQHLLTHLDSASHANNLKQQHVE